VAANGDIANWTTSLASSAPAVGGAMDLAAGARRIWVAMEHLTRKGTSRLTRACSMPITAAGVVSRIYTSHALLEPCGDHFQVIESLPGLSCEALQAITDAPLVFGEAWRGATYGDK
jgi:3-oxoadipate CoA-transferase beta subunit